MSAMSASALGRRQSMLQVLQKLWGAIVLVAAKAED